MARGHPRTESVGECVMTQREKVLRTRIFHKRTRLRFGPDFFDWLSFEPHTISEVIRVRRQLLVLTNDPSTVFVVTATGEDAPPVIVEELRWPRPTSFA